MNRIIHYLARYIVAVCATTASGLLIGAFIGAVSFGCAGYTVIFGIDQGFFFGMIFGYIWGVLFGWVVLRYGYIKSSPAAGFTLAFALLPALLGNPTLAWLGGVLGSLVAVPVVIGLCVKNPYDHNGGSS